MFCSAYLVENVITKFWTIFHAYAISIWKYLFSRLLIRLKHFMKHLSLYIATQQNIKRYGRAEIHCSHHLSSLQSEYWIFKEEKIKMMVNDSTTTNVILVDPFGGNVSMNILVSFAYTLSLGCSMFLFWFSWIERMNSFSNFRPVTQQLVSFCLVLVSMKISSILKFWWMKTFEI